MKFLDLIVCGTIREEVSDKAASELCYDASGSTTFVDLMRKGAEKALETSTLLPRLLANSVVDGHNVINLTFTTILAL